MPKLPTLVHTLRKSSYTKFALLLFILALIILLSFTLSIDGPSGLQDRVNSYLCSKSYKSDCFQDVTTYPEIEIDDPLGREGAAYKIYSNKAYLVSINADQMVIVQEEGNKSYKVTHDTNYGISIKYKKDDIETLRKISDLEEAHRISFIKQKAVGPLSLQSKEEFFVANAFPVSFDVFNSVVKKGNLVNIAYNKSASTVEGVVLLELD